MLVLPVDLAEARWCGASAMRMLADSLSVPTVRLLAPVD
jgi:hypothetical protein